MLEDTLKDMGNKQNHGNQEVGTIVEAYKQQWFVIQTIKHQENPKGRFMLAVNKFSQMPSSVKVIFVEDK